MSRRGLTAAFAAFVCFFFLCAGTPGLRSVGRKHRTEAGRAALHARLGTVFASITIGAGWVNDHIRRPLAAPLGPLQGFFGISQSWALYAGVDRTLRRMIVEVDGQLVYRSNDAEARWLAGPLGSRRMRPLLDKAVMRKQTRYWDSLTGFVVQHARADFPHVQSVRVLAVHQKRSPQAPPRIVYGRRAQAPTWTPTPLGADGEPESAEDRP